MVSVSQLAAALARIGRPSRANVFARELARPDMQAAISTLARDVRHYPNVEHLVTVRNGQPLLRATNGLADGVRIQNSAHQMGPRVTFAHNHPRAAVDENTDAPLSLNDLNLAMTIRGGYGETGLGRIAALVSDKADLLHLGSVARPTARGRRSWSKKAVQDQLAVERLAQRITEEQGGPQPFRNADDEALNRALHRLGLIEYGSRYRPEFEEALVRQRLRQRRMEDAYVRAFHGPVFGLPYPFRWSHVGGAAIGGGGAAAGVAVAERRKSKRRERRL